MAEEEEELSFEEQLKLEELERRKRDGALTKKDPDGTVYEWDDDKKAWFPKVCTTMKNKEMFFSWIIQQFLKVYNQLLKFQKKKWKCQNTSIMTTTQKEWIWGKINVIEATFLHKEKARGQFE